MTMVWIGLGRAVLKPDFLTAIVAAAGNGSGRDKEMRGFLMSEGYPASLTERGELIRIFSSSGVEAELSDLRGMIAGIVTDPSLLDATVIGIALSDIHLLRQAHETSIGTAGPAALKALLEANCFPLSDSQCGELAKMFGDIAIARKIGNIHLDTWIWWECCDWRLTECPWFRHLTPTWRYQVVRFFKLHTSGFPSEFLKLEDPSVVVSMAELKALTPGIPDKPVDPLVEPSAMT